MAGTETNSSLPLSTIILATDDTALTIGIEEAVRSAGATLHLAATPTTLLELVDSRFPVLILLDLGLPGDWVAAIRRCKLRPSTRQTPIYIFDDAPVDARFQPALRAGAMMAGLAASWNMKLGRSSRGMSIRRLSIQMAGMSRSMPTHNWRGGLQSG